MTDEEKTYEVIEVPKDELPPGLKSRTIYRPKSKSTTPKFGKAPAVLKILPYLEWGSEGYKPPPKGFR